MNRLTSTLCVALAVSNTSTERSFQVRRYECDLYEHLNNSHYLRYLDAVDEDLPPARGEAVRARIEFFKALVAGQTVRVIGQVADQREGWEQRQYEFMLGDEGIARAQVDFQHAGRVDFGVPVQEAAPQPAGVFRMNRPVEWRDIDVSGRMKAAGFASLAEDAGVRVSAAHEWPLTRCAKEGFAIVLRRHEIEFGAAVTLDDEVEISTWASDARRSAVIRHYLLRRRTDGAVVARFRSLYVWVSLGSGRPIRIPETFLASFAPNFAIG